MTIILLADQLQAHSKIGDARISKMVAGNSSLIGRLRRGLDLRTKTYWRIVEAFDRNWPDDLEWPADIPRPIKKEDAA